MVERTDDDPLSRLIGRWGVSYEIFENTDGQLLVVKSNDVSRVIAGSKQRLLAANLDHERLQPITRSEIEQLRPIQTHDYNGDISVVINRVNELIMKRNYSEAPYYAVFSGSRRAHFNVHSLPRQRIANCSEQRHLVSVSCDGHSTNIFSPNLDSEDKRLIEIWAAGREERRNAQGGARLRSEFEIRSLAYARLAEKLVLSFYRNALGLEAKDISITQINGRGDLWRSCDIETDVLIDVKNATNSGSRTRHIFVDKFKMVSGESVEIAGVISATHLEAIMRGRGKKARQTGEFRKYANQTFLGVTRNTSLESVQNAVNLLPGRPQEIRLSFYENNLPPWAFELPGAGVNYELLFSLSELFAQKPETILSTSIACGRHARTGTYSRLSDTQKDIVHNFSTVIVTCGVSKASIALFTISEFINRLLLGQNPTHFIKFMRKIVYIEGFSDLAQENDYDAFIDIEESHCLGLYDPTNSILDLFNLLSDCADSILGQDITFVHFNVPHPHLMIGRTEQGRYLTVYAYCGGKLPSGSWCSRFPLIIGEHKNCGECGKLICDQCDFCTEGCARPRQRRVAKKFACD
ncbi:hypothetical protein [Falsiroseomonas ponticola]|uniref:hypothetical protein n=1 Tax=Falsiroseomonas ponticola TaxID=2786951 RepID=UPI0019329131|nr:hypothetical protein [Roseomonas ponticola]